MAYAANRPEAFGFASSPEQARINFLNATGSAPGGGGSHMRPRTETAPAGALGAGILGKTVDKLRAAGATLPGGGDSSDGATGGSSGGGTGGSSGGSSDGGTPGTPDEMAYNAIASALSSLGSSSVGTGGSSPVVTLPAASSGGGGSLRVLVVLALLGVAGWLGWRYYQRRKGHHGE